MSQSDSLSPASPPRFLDRFLPYALLLTGGSAAVLCYKTYREPHTLTLGSYQFPEPAGTCVIGVGNSLTVSFAPSVKCPASVQAGAPFLIEVRLVVQWEGSGNRPAVAAVEKFVKDLESKGMAMSLALAGSDTKPGVTQRSDSQFRAVWSVSVPAAGKYEGLLHWALPDDVKRPDRYYSEKAAPAPSVISWWRQLVAKAEPDRQQPDYTDMLQSCLVTVLDRETHLVSFETKSSENPVAKTSALIGMILGTGAAIFGAWKKISDWQRARREKNKPLIVTAGWPPP